MPTRAEHYAMAEELLIEGQKAMVLIEETADLRNKLFAEHVEPDGFSVGFEIAGQISAITTGIAEYSLKAASIWAQAQVHATLATSPLNLGQPRSFLDSATTLTQMEARDAP